VGVRLEGQAIGAREAKVRDFELLAGGVNEQITRLQVSVHYSSLVTVN